MWWSWMGIEIRLMLTVDGWERETDEDGTAVSGGRDPSWSSVLRSGEFACSNFQTIHSFIWPNPTQNSHPRSPGESSDGNARAGQALSGTAGPQHPRRSKQHFQRAAACDEKPNARSTSILAPSSPAVCSTVEQSCHEEAVPDWLHSREMSGASPFPLASPIPQRRPLAALH